jgi:stage V sporulation protein D (sporulation-specific penicillin-binding protein)
MAAIANGGLLVQPHVVKEIRTPGGQLVRAVGPTIVRRVISAESAAEMRHALEQVVEKGTGRQAKIEGYRIAGKTGTANKVIGGRVAEDTYISSFFGFAPADKPRVIALITVDEPKGEYFGGVIAAPAFGAMMADILRYLSVPPTPRAVEPRISSGVTGVWVPDVTHMTVEDATEVLASAGLVAKAEGDGAVVAEQRPRPGAELRPGSAVTVTTRGAARGDGVIVPSVLGKTIKEATEILARFGLSVEVEGSGFAVRQDPAPGSAAPPDLVVRVQFSAPE